MNRFGKITLLLCGLLLTLAAFPVCGQEKDLTEIKINKRPLQDLGNTVGNLIDEKKVDLTASFLIEIQCAITADGKLDTSKAKVVRSEGDKQMIDLAKDAIAMIGDSGYFQYLQGLGAEDLNLLVVQDDSNFTGTVNYAVESRTRAQALKMILGSAIRYYRDKKSTADADENDKEDLAILNAATVETDAKKVTIKFNMAKSAMHAIIRKWVARNQLKPVAPNGMAKNGVI